ncbi:N-6 DNA methylase [Kribbella voronezhensis]|uniref:N-6 DNA methylase n=1 Tax=Kribbella voronezhensis TaxID=2512212 RepID=A0A4R7SV88_9ACTN|nr:N-6 DNA methylase [Kribbella voronezhensis]
MTSEVTIAALDIARVAGVGRAAVSNWRRRHSDFPQPVGGTTSSPLFSLNQVESWLDEHGKSFRLSEADRFWQRVRTSVDDIRLGEFVGHIGACLVLAKRQPEVWRRSSVGPAKKVAAALESAIARSPDLPRTDLDTFPDSWVALFKEAAELASTVGPSTTYERLCERYQETRARRGVATGPEVVDLIARIASTAICPGGSVMDPSCGIGTLLKALRGAGGTRSLGQSADEFAARICASRLLLDCDQQVQVAAADAVKVDAFKGELVDVVACEPAVDRAWGYDELIADSRWELGLPPRSEPELAWLQHCLAHLRPGGLGAVVLPAAVASRRAGRRIRGNLLRAGLLRAIIALPLSGPGVVGPRDLWILIKADGGETPQSVLMVDGSHESIDVPATWQAFLSDQVLGDGARAVRVIDLLDDEIDLSPTRQLALSKPSDGSEYVEAEAAWCKIIDALGDALPRLSQRGPAEQLTMTTIGELSKAGVIAIHQPPIRMETRAGDEPVLTAKDVRHGQPASQNAAPSPGAVELLRGDVVAPLLRAGQVRVISEGGTLLGSNLVMLRPDAERMDPEFLAGCLRAAEHEAPARPSGVSGRFDTRKVRVPRLAIDEQRRLGTAFKELATLESRLAELQEVSTKLMQTARLGLIQGVIEAGRAT